MKTKLEINEADRRDLTILAKEIKYARKHRELEVADTGLNARRVKSLLETYGDILNKIARGEVKYVGSEYCKSGSKQPFKIGNYGRGIYLPARLEW